MFVSQVKVLFYKFESFYIMMRILSLALSLLVLTAAGAAAQKKLDIAIYRQQHYTRRRLTASVAGSSPVKAWEWLKQAMPDRDIQYSNQGVSGSTTVELPAGYGPFIQ